MTTARSSLGLSNNSSSIAVSDIFSWEQSPSYWDGALSAFCTQNLHDDDNNTNSRRHYSGGEDPLLRSRTSPSTDGMLQHHVEMLVVVLRDEEAWKVLQQSMRDDLFAASENGCTHMAVRHGLDGLLRAGFRRAVERQNRDEDHHHQRAQHDKPIINELDDKSGDEEETGTLETASISSSSSSGHSSFGGNDDDDDDNDDDNNVEEESGEFLMGGRIGDRSYLRLTTEPISYKDIDLLRHPRSQILGRREVRGGGGGLPPHPSSCSTSASILSPSSSWGTPSVRIDPTDNLQDRRDSAGVEASSSSSSSRPRPCPQVSFV